MTARLAVTVAGVAVKAWLCDCGCLVFGAPSEDGEPLIFDAEPAPDLYEMIAGNCCIYYRQRHAPSYRVHFCPVELAIEVDE